MIVANLKPRKIAYYMKVEQIVNAPSAQEDVRIWCRSCPNTASCTPASYIDQADVEISYMQATLPKS